MTGCHSSWPLMPARSAVIAPKIKIFIRISHIIRTSHIIIDENAQNKKGC